MTPRAKKAGGNRIHVRQVRSGIGYSVRQKATLEALGLGRVGSRREMADNPQVRAMVASVRHLVVIENGDGTGRGEPDAR